MSQQLLLLLMVLIRTRTISASLCLTLVEVLLISLSLNLAMECLKLNLPMATLILVVMTSISALSTGLPRSSRVRRVSTCVRTLWLSSAWKRQPRRQRLSSQARWALRLTCLTLCQWMEFLSTWLRLWAVLSLNNCATTLSRALSSLVSRPCVTLTSLQVTLTR